MTDKEINDGYDDEEMTVELELDDGQIVNCAVITILTVDKKTTLPCSRLMKTETTTMAKYGFINMKRTRTIQTKNPS